MSITLSPIARRIVMACGVLWILTFVFNLVTEMKTWLINKINSVEES